MPQLIALLLFLAIAWIGYRKFIADAERLRRHHDELRRREANNTQGTLVQDPETGEYRLKQD
ncbi:hypothetical protein [Ensifer soli]|uniref:hypothetical protein n=1 Tax=Ciceribacter sp. sgz301302 TaxID=3342379 RepID=UPI0035B72008